MDLRELQADYLRKQREVTEERIWKESGILMDDSEGNMEGSAIKCVK